MSITVLTQDELQERVGGEDALAILASPQADLDAEAEAVITAAIADASSEIEGALAGLGIDYTTIPDTLKGIGATLAKGRIYEMVWSLIPAAVEKEMEVARKKLKAYADGFGSADGSTPAQQEAARFSHSNIGDYPSTSNPRQTVNARMKRCI